MCTKQLAHDLPESIPRLCVVLLQLKRYLTRERAQDKNAGIGISNWRKTARFHQVFLWALFGIGEDLAVSPSHTTVHTGHVHGGSMN